MSLREEGGERERGREGGREGKGREGEGEREREGGRKGRREREREGGSKRKESWGKVIKLSILSLLCLARIFDAS